MRNRDNILDFVCSYYDKKYDNKIQAKIIEFEALRKEYRKKEVEKIINEVSKVDLSAFKNSTLNIKKISTAIDVSYENFEKESLYNEIINERCSLEERRFTINKVLAQDTTSEFRNTDEIERFIDDCMKGTYTEDLIKRLYE